MPGSPSRPSRARTPAAKRAAESPPASATSSPGSVPLPEALAEVAADKLATALQAHLLASTQLMQRFIQSKPDGERAKWERALGHLQTTLRMVHKSGSSETLPAEPMPGDEALDPERVQEFGQLVASLRTAAGLSRRELSRRTGLSEKTIWNVEDGSNVPTHATVLRPFTWSHVRLTV